MFTASDTDRDSRASVNARRGNAGTLERIKAASNVRDGPYQSLIKVWLEEKLS